MSGGWGLLTEEPQYPTPFVFGKRSLVGIPYNMQESTPYLTFPILFSRQPEGGGANTGRRLCGAI